MKPTSGTLLFGVFAILFGLLGAYVVRKELHKPAEKVQVAKDAKPQTFPVPLASNDLEPGRKITLGDITMMKLTAAQMKTQHISGNYMPSPKQIIGRVLKQGLKEGSTFDTPDFYPEGTGPGVTPKVKSGFRAVTITVENDGAVAGFAIPGVSVEVFFRANAGEPKNELPETTISLIESAEVLAMNQDTVSGARPDRPDANAIGKKAAVTLSVTPRQAADLRVAEGRGTLWLALRNSDDLETDSEPLAPRTLDELLERPSQNQKHKMEIFRGGRVSRVEFPDQLRGTPPARIAVQPLRRTTISNPQPFGAAK